MAANVNTTEDLLSKLFRFKKTFTYRDVTFYQRVVTDQVIEDSRKAALLESRKLRHSLRNPSTDDYLVFIDPMEDLTDDELIASIVYMASREVMRDYIQRTPRPILEPLGDYPGQEEQENREAALEEREEQYIKDMQEYIEKWSEEFTTTLKARTRAQLAALYRRHRTDGVCEERFTEEFEDRVFAASLYTDDTYKKRLFSSVDEYRQLPVDVRAKVREEYDTITLTQEDIKN